MIQKRPRTLEKVGRNLSLVALVIMLVALPFEQGVDATYKGAQVAVLLGFLLRLGAQVKWRFWAVAVAAFIVSAGFFATIALLVHGGDKTLYGPGEVIRRFFTQVGVLYFCMILVFLSQFVYRPRIWTPHDRWTKVTLACAWVFAIITIIAAIASRQDPIESLRYVRKFFAPYLLIYMIVVETLYSWRHFKIIITTVFLVGVVTSIASLSIRYLYLTGGPDLKRVIYDNAWVRDQEFESVDTGGVKHTWREVRNQWPFDHHNRLCSFTMMICFFAWLQFFVTRNWELRTLVAISVFLPFWTMMMTLTRGGWLGLAAGMVALILMVNWRSIGLFLVIAVATWWVSPEPVREKILSIFQVQTYTSGLGTASDRIVIWEHALQTIGKHPVFGLGYGWELFEQYWERHFDPLPSGQDISHAHNNFLEVAVETGLVGLAFFLLYCAALVGQLFRTLGQAVRQSRRRFVVAGFFGLFVAITVFGLSNYSLRYRMGMLIWVSFALITLLPGIIRFISLKGDRVPNDQAEPPAEPAQA